MCKISEVFNAGIFSAGTPVFGILWSSITPYLLNNYGLQGTASFFSLIYKTIDLYISSFITKKGYRFLPYICRYSDHLGRRLFEWNTNYDAI